MAVLTLVPLTATAQQLQSPPPDVADARFASFVQDFRATAIAAGISPVTYDAAMSGIARNPDVEAANLNQPEFSRPIWDYLDSAVSDQKIANGLMAMESYQSPLASIQARFGVPKEILVAIWGDETNYGRIMGRFNMFEALATLAYDGPRSAYARNELIDALKMVQQEALDPRQMTSSWAGAFGNTQFVPSTFLKFAVDGDGDGRRDLWQSAPDALASAANLLVAKGWVHGEPCVQEIVLPAGFDYTLADGDTQHSAADWQKMGVSLPSGAVLPDSPYQTAIYLPAGARGPAFLVYDNFKVILRYNNSAPYALAVCYLAKRLAGGPAIAAPWPRDEKPMSRDDRIAFQMNLARLGYDVGDIDGLLGRRVRACLRLYQKAHGLPADGFPTQALLRRIMQEGTANPG